MQEDLSEHMLLKGLIKWDAGAGQSPAITRSMLRPVYDEVFRQRVLSGLHNGQRRPCTDRGLLDMRPLVGSAWVPSSRSLAKSYVPSATAMLGNGDTVVCLLLSLASCTVQAQPIGQHGPQTDHPWGQILVV
jgi:hypothetical protein